MERKNASGEGAEECVWRGSGRLRLERKRARLSYTMKLDGISKRYFIRCAKQGLKISFCIPVGEGCRWLDLDERRCRVHSAWNRRHVPVGLRIWRSGTGRLFTDLQKADLQIKMKEVDDRREHQY
ncbi:hypothetical protein DVH24_034106 [Malus domestica]|uniref:Uncharacterized protein n=1 Tax=Malus domestica TaxID=3750 RepID=A0A498KMX6_MALDO|nr:hypothetical protein DVH24_034106 [Malus domestica]